MAFLTDPWTGRTTALIDAASGRSLTYDSLERAVSALAGQLAASGVGVGQRIALIAPNRLATVVAFLAIIRTGAAATPINPALTDGEIERMTEQLAVDRMLGADSIDDASFALASQEAAPPLEPWFRPDALALLLQTSGTTGRPKAVPIRQRNLAASASTIADTYQLGPDDVAYGVMPLFHVHGLVGIGLSTLASGGTVVLGAPSMALFWDDAATHGVTWLSAVPTILARIAARPAESHRGRLRFARSASSPLPPSLASRLEAELAVPMLEAYGMTECTHQLASNPLPPSDRRLGSVGRATGCDIQVMGEAWDVLPVGAAGEVVVRGPNVVDGYLDNPEATADSFRDGWFRTGDVGVLDGDGYLRLVGRIKELINRAGEKISPREVDEALLTHPDVVEAASYGVPDDTYGEVVHAAVVVRGDVTAEELRQYCLARIARFKVPAVVHLVDTIPKGPTGKVQRTELATALG